MKRLIWLLLGIGIVLAACNTETASRNEIVCHTAYRSSVSVGIEQEETFTFTDSSAEAVGSYDALTFRAVYSDGAQDGERGLHVSVTEVGKSAFLTAQLYQLPQDSGPMNQFVGGHGFTGLNYVYHPESGAELQYWCEAVE